MVTFDARIHSGRGSILRGATLGLSEVADEEPGKVTLSVYAT